MSDRRFEAAALSLPGLLLLEPRVHVDSRGSFEELFRAKDYEERARSLFAILKDGGGILLDTNDDDVIDPTVEQGMVRSVRLLRG